MCSILNQLKFYTIRSRLCREIALIRHFVAPSPRGRLTADTTATESLPLGDWSEHMCSDGIGDASAARPTTTRFARPKGGTP